MKYPTLEQVEKADKTQLAQWVRFLPSPGIHVKDAPEAEFYSVIKQEAAVLSRVMDRFKELGGWTSGLSKRVGFDSTHPQHSESENPHV